MRKGLAVFACLVKAQPSTEFPREIPSDLGLVKQLGGERLKFGRCFRGNFS